MRDVALVLSSGGARGLAHIGEWRNRVMKEFQENKPERDYHLYSQYVKELQAIKQGLMASKKKIN